MKPRDDAELQDYLDGRLSAAQRTAFDSIGANWLSRSARNRSTVSPSRRRRSDTTIDLSSSVSGRRPIMAIALGAHTLNWRGS